MKISEKYINEAFDYTAYRTNIDNLLNEGKVTGPIQTEDLVKYTELNVHRMNRVDKTSIISEELSSILTSIKSTQIWLVITEGWCGDAAQIVPFFHVLEKQFPAIKLKFILRDDNLELMDQFLTNGARAIPKLLVIESSSLELLAHWGPRPAAAQALIQDLKDANANMDVIKEKLHLWYAKNRSEEVQKELIHLLSVL